MSDESTEARIVAVVTMIPVGRVCGYGWVADLAGLPGRGRLVARVLRQGDDRLPWYRVLRSDGCIAFLPNSPGFREQAQRLRKEGVAVRQGKVDLTRFGWRGDLDGLLWGRHL